MKKYFFFSDITKMFEEHLIRPKKEMKKIKKNWFGSHFFDKNTREQTRGRGHWVKAWQKQRKQEEKERALILKYAVHSRKNLKKYGRNKTLSSSPSMVFHLHDEKEHNEGNEHIFMFLKN